MKTIPTTTMNREKLAELTSSTGALILGIGIGIYLAGALRGTAIWFVLIGALLHGWGMFDRHRSLEDRKFSLRPERDSGFPRMERLGEHLAFAWTETAAGAPSRLRAALVPLAAVAPPRTSIGEERRAPASAGLAVGASMPEYAAVALNDERVSLASLRGQVVLLNIWATWCEPCRHELPEIAELQRRHGGKGLRVVGVSVDQQKTRAEIRDFLTRRKLSYEIWHDPDDRASATFALGVLPVTLLFDRSGVLVWRRDGAVTASDPALNAAIEAAITVPRR